MLQSRVVLLALVLTAATPLVGCQTVAAGGQASAGAPTPKEAVAKAALVLDVRTAAEVAGGSLPQAVHIPVDQIEARLDEITAKLEGDKTKPIAVYCASGNRSGKAKATLEKAGFTQVTNVGGYGALK